MANSDKDLVITPNRGSSSADPKIVFSGASSTLGPQNITLQVYPTNSGTLSFEGSAGQLFSITNSMSGTIFSANDVSGIPSIEVIDTGLVKLAQYGGNVLIGTGTDSGYKLRVAGTAHITQLGVGSANNTSYDFYNNGTSYFNGAVIIEDNLTMSGSSGIFLNRIGQAIHGISYYSSSYTSWSTYMAPGAATSTGPTGNITASTGAYVTSWALRNFVESSTAYGFIWESGTSTGQPSTVAELRSTDGLFHAYGNIYKYNSPAGGVIVPGLTISDSAPTGTVNAGDLWWESDTGKLKVRYNDGTSTQWVDAVPIPDLTTYYSKAGGTITGPVVVNSSITTTGYVFAPRFVDVDSPSYYVDPGAATSALFAGNVGVGTTSPGKRLTVSRASETTSEQLEFRNEGGITTGNYDGILFTQGASGGTTLANIRVLYNSSGTPDMVFNLRNDSNVVFLKNGGNVGIGTTAPATKLDVNGTATATTFNSTSDRNLKENFEFIASPVEKISQLNGYTYNFKSDEDKRRHAGIVAQDVVKVLPEAVSGNSESGLRVSYNDIVALLVEAVKEQQSTIKELQILVEQLSQKPA